MGRKAACALVLAAVGAWALAACSGDDGGGDSGSPASAATGTGGSGFTTGETTGTGNNIDPNAACATVLNSAV